MQAREARQAGIRYLVITFFVIFSAFPFYWMLITSFKTDADLYNPRNNPFTFNEITSPTVSSGNGDEAAEFSLIPNNATGDNFVYLFNNTNYGRFIINSLVVGVATVIITIVLAVPAAYSLARLAGRFGEQLGIMMFVVYLVPPTLLFIPLSQIVTLLGLRDSVWALIVVYPTFTVPFCTWLLMGFMKSIPKDIEEQAMVDGYSRFGAILRVVFPLALPGVLTIIVFTFTLTLHEFIYALAFISSSSQKVISTGVTSELIRGDVFFWQEIMAGGIIVAIPLAILYNIFLNQFVTGFTMGAVKG
ncbi:MAG: carbohydrate ABC transporter permease [Chloroflexota bacterium]